MKKLVAVSVALPILLYIKQTICESASSAEKIRRQEARQMSIRVKNDSWYWKDSEGHYHTTAVFSEMLPSEVESTKNTAVAAVNSAGTTQIGNVNTAGSAQVTAVENAGTTQVGLVNQAGSDQVDAVKAAGDTQVGLVNQAGSAQITAINNILSQLQADITDLQNRVTALENA